MDNTNLRLKVFHGVDVKRLQYEENAIDLSNKIIDLPDAIGNNLFNKRIKFTSQYKNSFNKLQFIKTIRCQTKTNKT